MQDYLLGAVGLGISIATSIITASITVGVMKNKIDQFDHDIDDIRIDHKELQNHIAERYVPMEHFNSLERRITEMQRDLRSILVLVSSRGGSTKRNPDAN
jgi:predicted  nucleic acid-binding Zn-ribbon protein